MTNKEKWSHVIDDCIEKEILVTPQFGASFKVTFFIPVDEDEDEYLDAFIENYFINVSNCEWINWR